MSEPRAAAAPGKGMEVMVLGDGFVRADGERIPLEAWILRARQRVRALPREERREFWVQVRCDASAGDAVRPYLERLVEEFRMLGVLVFWM